MMMKRTERADGVEAVRRVETVSRHAGTWDDAVWPERRADRLEPVSPSGICVARCAGAAALLMALAACGGAEGPNGEKGPVIGTRPQSLTFATLPTLAPNETGTVTATASSGLKVRYSSLTPGVCTVEAETGRVSALASGTCTLSASQAGDTTWAAVTQQQQLAVSPDLRFDDIGDLVVGDAAMLTVSTPRGQKVRYRSETPTVCSMDASSGLMTALAAGTCTVVAEVEGLLLARRRDSSPLRRPRP